MERLVGSGLRLALAGGFCWETCRDMGGEMAADKMFSVSKSNRLIRSGNDSFCPLPLENCTRSLC